MRNVRTKKRVKRYNRAIDKMLESPSELIRSLGLILDQALNGNLTDRAMREWSK